MITAICYTIPLTVRLCAYVRTHTYNPECLHSVRVCQSTLLQLHIRTYPRAGVPLHELYLFISNILSTVCGWLLHRCQTQNLQQMVLHHIPGWEGGDGWRLRWLHSQRSQARRAHGQYIKSHPTVYVRSMYTCAQRRLTF